MAFGRPVKWIEDRRENFLVTHQERDQWWDLEIAVDQGRQAARPARPPRARQRRLYPVGPRAAVDRGDDRARPLRAAGLRSRSHRALHQQDPVHAGARRRPSAGRVRDGADDGPRRGQAGPRPRGGAAAQLHPARADALQGRHRLPRRPARHLRQRRLSRSASAPHSTRSTGTASPRARRRRWPRAAISASPSPTPSKAPASAPTRARRCASRRPAR